MMSTDEKWQRLFDDLARLRERWPAADWDYDRRLRCVVSTLDLEQAEQAKALMAEVMPRSWTSTTLPGAPERPREIADRGGGLRAGQLLWWGGDDGEPGPYALWWPWGNGKAISIRIGLHDLDAPKQRYPQLRDVFGIPQAEAPA